MKRTTTITRATPPAKRLKRASSLPLTSSTVRAARKTRIELKRKSEAIYSVEQVVNSSWSFHPLPRIQEGGHDNQRDGRAVKLLEFDHIISYQCGEVPNDSIRFVYVLWKQALNAPTPADVFNNIIGIPTITQTYNISNAANYEILGDYIYNSPPGANASGTSLSIAQVYRHTRKLNLIQTYYDTASTAVADKQIYCFAISGLYETRPISSNCAISYIDV